MDWGRIVDAAVIAGTVFLFLFAGLAIWFVIALFRALLHPFSAVPRRAPVADPDADADGMNPGDYYNGPHGYSPMTGYPETQYGSGFDPDAEWNHERE